MGPATIEELYRGLVAQLGIEPVRRQLVREWEMSRVERWWLPDRTVVAKYAREPFTGEGRILAFLAAQGVPVPRLHGETLLDGVMGMLLEDLGEAVDVPGIGAAAAAAVAVHTARPPLNLPVVDAARLRALPQAASRHLKRLQGVGRWTDGGDIAAGLTALSRVAGARAADVEQAPYGLCHSEFHPTSLLRDATGTWRLLDFARAFVGPGLLDLVSWQGTTAAPDLAEVRELLHVYREAGGPDTVLADRAGLGAECWAVGWHRVWIIEWYLEQAVRWIPDRRQDAASAAVVRRHLAEAITHLRA